MTHARWFSFVVVVVGVGVACGGSKPAPSSASGSAPASPSASGSISTSGSSGCPAGALAIPGGSFALVATKDAVGVKPHCLDRTEVTVAAYDACVKKGACSEPDAWVPKGNGRWCNWKRPGDFASDPVNCLDHAQAAAYCASVHGRLPDDGEWEWSARGGEKGTAYPWGNDPPNGRACWDGEESDGDADDADSDLRGTCKVGSFPSGANPFGVLDLAGDVWEWTESNTAPPDKAFDRGGGWLNGVRQKLLAGARNVVDAKGRWSSVGFRCAYDR